MFTKTFDDADTEKTTREDGKERVRLEGVAKEEYDTIADDLTDRLASILTKEGDIAGIDSDIAGQEELQEGETPGTDEYDGPQGEIDALNITKGTYEGELATLKEERDSFSGQKDELDKANAGASADAKLGEWKAKKEQIDEFNTKVEGFDEREEEIENMINDLQWAMDNADGNEDYMKQSELMDAA